MLFLMNSGGTYWAVEEKKKKEGESKREIRDIMRLVHEYAREGSTGIISSC